MSINSAVVAGNLTRNAELKQTSSGKSVLHFSVAVNDRAKNNQTGEWEDKPNFVPCVMFGNRAQAVAQYLTKGTKVSVQGKLHYSSWQGNDGKNRSKLEVMVDELEFMSRGNQQQPAQQQYQQQFQQPAQQYQQQAPQPDPQPLYDNGPQPLFEDGIPF